MSKKFLPLISFLLIAAFMLAACQPAATTTPAPVVQPTTAEAQPTAVPPTAVPTLKGKVTLWQGWKEAEIASLNYVIAAFKEKNPDVTVEVLYVPFDNLRNKFETETATGGGPSVLIGAADWGPALFDASLVADITADMPQTLLDTINPAALGAVQYKGALIGLPETIKGVLLFRNKQIIANPVTTFADLVTAAKAATTADISGAYLEQGFFFSIAHLMGLGGKLMNDDGSPAFNDAKGVEWLNLVKSFADAGPVTNYTDDDVNLFKEGKVGWIIDGSWNTSALAKAIGADNLAIDPWPTPLSGFVQTENIYLGANATGDDKAASLEFIKYFLSPEAQTLLAEPTLAGHIPAISGVTLTDPLMSQTVEGFKAGAAFPVIPAMGAYWDPGNNAIKKVVQENVDPAAALQEAFDAITTALKK